MEKVIITTGGTGGHVFPSITLAKELTEFVDPDKIVFLGGGLDNNPYFEKSSFSHHSVPTATFSLKNPISAIKGFYRLNQGVRESVKLLTKIQPKLVIGFGSFHTLPVLLAARWKGIPILLHEANAYPGKVNRLMSRFSESTGIQFPEASKHLRGLTQIVPLPLRADLKKVAKEEARISLQLDPSKTTILVFGGSQGASKLNQWIEQLIPHLKSIVPHVQVIHLTGGSIDVKRIYEREGIEAHVAPFSDKMHHCWSAADLAITRSGASTVAEMIHFAVPTIFIPYPFATDNHQELNGAFVVEKIGGAVQKKQSELTLEWWLKVLERLFSQRQQTLKAMKRALMSYRDDFHSQSLFEMVKEWYEK